MRKADASYHYPLLLTGTIDSAVYQNVGNKIQDVRVRLKQYESSIERYICSTPFNPIVFIENSGYEFDSGRFETLAEAYHKQFEFISGTVCKAEVIRYGKSYGDAFLIHEGLQKSRLLKEEDFFYKITGRIFLKNSRQICRTRDKYRNEFITYTGMGWCLTNIFKANREDYLRVLDSVYEDCDEAKVRDIEISFYHRLVNSDMNPGSFETYPYFDGVMGATLRKYSGGGIERAVRNVMARCHCFTLRSPSSSVIRLYMKLRGMKGYRFE